ncbi:MAG: sel1 repeat family protein [Betaproteobacteria bacterium]|nr:MAG: sel1 repeat family protein [Betaproteobacteria bacterium]
MFIKCPTCGSLNVRRSSIRPPEASAPRLRSPYRCRDCGERFLVISRRAMYFVAMGAIATLAGALAWNVVGVPEEPRRGSEREALVAESVADTIKRAERDDAAAEYKLAHMYATGTGVEGNKRDAQTWLERAARHGSTEAQYELGNALREGSGVVQDYELAARWLELAAVKGNPDAQYALGQMYHSGMGVPADNAKAYMWFNLAAARDVPGASVQRDALLRALTPAQVLEAQADARRLSQAPAKRSDLAP